MASARETSCFRGLSRLFVTGARDRNGFKTEMQISWQVYNTLDMVVIFEAL